MVLLKPSCVTHLLNFFASFTFHYGLIKTLLLFAISISISPFTFHYGLIKTHSERLDRIELAKFTFHYGLIKTPVVLSISVPTTWFTFHYGLIKTNEQTTNLGKGFEYLHSTMVLLKPG